MIQLKNISHYYDDEIAVKNFSLNIQEGRTTVLIGPSGCGKSTLMRILTGLVHPTNGEVIFENEKLVPKNVLAVRRKIGYVIQEGGLFPHLNAYNNIALIAKHLKWSDRKIRERVNKLSKLTNINLKLLNSFPVQLSGGQKQRVSLMRALMLDPDYLLLDEPLGALDPLVRYDLQNDLKEIFEKLNKTVIMVTHDLAEALFFGHTIVLMKEGEIVQKGRPKELIESPKNEFVKKFITAQRNHLEV